MLITSDRLEPMRQHLITKGVEYLNSVVDSGLGIFNIKNMDYAKLLDKQIDKHITIEAIVHKMIRAATSDDFKKDEFITFTHRIRNDYLDKQPNIKLKLIIKCWGNEVFTSEDIVFNYKKEIADSLDAIVNLVAHDAMDKVSNTAIKYIGSDNNTILTDTNKGFIKNWVIKNLTNNVAIMSKVHNIRGGMLFTDRYITNDEINKAIANAEINTHVELVAENNRYLAFKVTLGDILTIDGTKEYKIQDEDTEIINIWKAGACYII